MVKYQVLLLTIIPLKIKEIMKILFSLDSSKVLPLQKMFLNIKNMTSISFAKNYDTKNIKDMSYMFDGCSSLTLINMPFFDASNVIDMSFLFSECSSLTSIDISNFITSNVIKMDYLFDYCYKLKSINLSNFNTQNIE